MQRPTVFKTPEYHRKLTKLTKLKLGAIKFNKKYYPQLTTF